NRRVVEAQHQHVAFDATGRQPVAGPCPRADHDGEAAIGTADDLRAGEAVALHGICDQLSLRIVERHGPIARWWSGAAERDVTTPVEQPAIGVAGSVEGDAVARTDRQLAAAREDGMGIRVNAGRAALWPCRPR